MISDSITRIVGDRRFAEELISSIRTGLIEHATSEDVETFVLRRFEEALYAVIPEVDGHPTGELLKLLIREESERTNAEVIQCLEFIYSHMVNKFQGDLAEFLSVVICSEIGGEWKREGRLPPEARYIWGDDIRERKSAGPSAGDENAWHKGADGFFIAEQAHLADASPRTFETTCGPQATDLAIFGVVEVKSYATSYQRATAQIEKHLARLQAGLKIAGQEWPPERLYFVRWDSKSGVWVRTPVIRATRPEILRLLVKPRRVKSRKALLRPSLPPNASERTLSRTKKILAAAAYHMTVWFIERLGGRVFEEHSNPWPEFTQEEAGVNTVKQALYYIILRDLPKRQAQIATRLYNVYGFGYENAERHKDMIWSVRGELVSEWKEPEPSMDVPPAMELDQIVECAWSFYRRCHMEEAIAYIDAAMSMGPDESGISRLEWLQGMIHYYHAEFEEAAQRLRTPAADRQGDWWARDKLTLASIFVRLGRIEEAVREIEQVSSAKLPDKFLLISIPVWEAMVFISRGQTDEGRQRLNVAFSNLRTVRAEMEERKAQGLGEPSHYNPAAIQIAAMEMATGFVLLADFRTAMTILSHVRDVFPPTLLLMARDPALEALRRAAEQGLIFQTWLEERQREVRLKSK